MRLGIVLDPGSPDCRHQALASICAYEYCTACDYKFIGHCSKCAKRSQKLEDYIAEKLAELKKKLNG